MVSLYRYISMQPAIKQQGLPNSYILILLLQSPQMKPVAAINRMPTLAAEMVLIVAIAH
jgi:hypothetical protein